jgi:outer membrane protein OmpA-like peptidoglycan-associated protein
MNRNLYHFSLIVLSIILLKLTSYQAFSQEEKPSYPFKGYVYLQPNAGVSQYYGDLNSDDLWNKNPKLGYGASLGYQISPLFGIRGQFLKTDLYSESTSRNQKFSSDLWDGALNLTLNINEIFAKYNDKRFLNLYLFTGAGLTSFSSKIEDYTTSAIITKSAQRQNELIVPIGAGASFRLSNVISINIEYGDHMTFNDNTLDLTSSGKPRDHYSYASAGINIRFGAKDTDGDGVKDKVDMCPEVPGKVELLGCPDKDNDGIADKDDACPDVAGKAEFKGCPDSDGDGIIDSEDACPGDAGKKELNGCPDRDNDGIADKDDKCPDEYGKKEFSGCPDRDGDGIPDKTDDCPNVKGLAEFNGCPDRDGDGIPDNKDNCPDVAGVADNHGCPAALKGAVMEKTVYFHTDGSVTMDEYIIVLNEIAAYMNENPDAAISVAGHADARESAEYNMRLSEKRADYVINYLKKKGMKSTKVEKLFYGKSKPVADNSTTEGRALNRRVEIRITK